MLPFGGGFGRYSVDTIDAVCGGGDFWMTGATAEILPALVKAASENQGNDK